MCGKSLLWRTHQLLKRFSGDPAVLGEWLNSMSLKVLSNRNDSVIP